MASASGVVYQFFRVVPALGFPEVADPFQQMSGCLHVHQIVLPM